MRVSGGILKWSSLAVFLFATAVAGAEEATAPREPSPAASRKISAEEAAPTPPQPADTTVPPTADPEGSQAWLLERLSNKAFKPVRSLLVEREMPLVGIRWGADIQGDIPLNGEPDDAAPTLREARLIFYRSFGREWSAKLQANYNSEGNFEIGDTYFVFTGWKTASAKFGVFKPSYSLEHLTGRIGLTFLERALPVGALSARRGLGIGVSRRTPKSILDAGFSLFGPKENGQREKGQGISLRYVHAPLGADTGLGWGVIGGRGIWFGVSAAYGANASEQDTQFRSLPEVGITDEYFVDTGKISGANSIARVAFEASKVVGSFSWQAEALTTQVWRDGAENVMFYGGYAFASWILTGETRNYSATTGEFRNLSPNSPIGQGGWGAWELAVRASTVDLNDQDIVGGRERNLSMGVNWYLNDQMRVQANLIKVLDVRRPGSKYDGQDPWIAALRLQWYLP